MSFELFDTGLLTADPPRWLLLKDLLQEVACFDRETLWDRDLFGEDIVHTLDKRHLSVCFEWVNTGEHLVKNKAPTVPVHRVAVLLIFNYFRCQVLRSAAKALGSTIAAIKTRLGKSEVSETDVTVAVDQDILRL